MKLRGGELKNEHFKQESNISINYLDFDAQVEYFHSIQNESQNLSIIEI